LTKLTTAMRDALEEAAHDPLRRLHVNGSLPPWPAHHSTLAALVGHGLLEHDRRLTKKGHRLEEWTITDAGQDALKPREIVKRDRPLYLARAGRVRYRLLPPAQGKAHGRWAIDETAADGDYTSDPSRSIDHDLAPGKTRLVAVEVLDTMGAAVKAAERETDRRRERGQELDATPIDARLDLMRRVARHHRMDVNRDARLIRHLIDKGRTQAAAARLVALETQLGQRAA
jgi:hypothetical protein